MALIKLGAMFDRISGKVGGQSISNRGQTTTIRNINHTNKTPTKKQSLQRFILAGITNAYRFLLAADLASWQATALNYTYVNRVGDTVTRNGYQTFCFCNQNLDILGVSPLTTAPTYIPVTQPKINLIDISSGNFEIGSNNADSAYLYALFAAPNLSNGTSNAVSKMKFCGTITAAQLAAGYDVISDIESVYGSLSFPNKISIIIDPINQTTGNRSQEVTEIFNQDTPLILQVTVNNGDTIQLPTKSGYSYSGTVNFGQGSNASFSAYNDASLSHTYTASGVFNIVITGTFQALDIGNATWKASLSDIIQFGSVSFRWLSFSNCDALTSITAPDTPTLATGVSLYFTFQYCNTITSFPTLANWDVTNARSMKQLFRDVEVLLDVSNWNVSLFTSLEEAFWLCEFAPAVANWEVGNVTIMKRAFTSSPLDADLSNWDVSSCTNMTSMFEGCTSFDSDLSNWDVSGVTDFSRMFRTCLIFDQDLSSWDISAATNMTLFGANANFSDANWDAMLNAWAALTTPPSNITIDINATHTAAANAAYTTLTTTYSWTINENV